MSIDLVIRGIDQASDTIGKISKEVGGLEGVMNSAGGIAGGVFKVGMLGAAAGVSAVAGGLVAAIASVGSWANTLDSLQDVLGGTTQENAALAVAISNVGGNVEGVAQQFTFLARGLETAKGELGPTGLELKKLGISVYDANGNLKDTTAIAVDVASAFSKMPDGIEKSALMTRIMGRSGRDLSDVMNELANGGLARADEQAKALGLSLSDDAVRGSKAFDRSMTVLQMSLRGVAVTIGASLLPFLQRASGMLQEFLASPIIQNGAKEIAIALGLIGDGHVWSGIIHIGEAFGFTEQQMKPLADMFTTLQQVIFGKVAPALERLRALVGDLADIVSGKGGDAFMRFGADLAGLGKILGLDGAQVEAFGRRFAQALEFIVFIVTDLFDVFSGKGGDAIAGFAADVAGLGTLFGLDGMQVERFANGALTNLWQIMGDVSRFLTGTFTNAFNTVQGAITAFQKFGIGGLLASLGASPQAVKGVETALLDLMGAIKSGDFANILGGVFKVDAALGATLLEGLRAVGTRLAPIVQGWANIMGPAVESLFARLVTWAQGAAPLLLSAIGGIGAQLGPMIQGWGDLAGPPITAFVARLVTWVQSQLPVWSAALIQFGTAAWTWIEQAIPPLLERLGVLGAQMVGWVSAQLPGWSASFVQFATAAAAWVQEAIPPLLANLGAMGTQLIGWVQTQLPGWTASLSALIGPATQWVLDALPGLIINLGVLTGQLLSWAVLAAADAIGWFLPLAQQFFTWIARDVVPQLPGALLAITEAILLFLLAAGVTLAPALSELGNRFVDWVTGPGGPADRIGAELGKFWTNVTRALATFMADMLLQAGNIGKSLIDGIVGGIQSRVAAAIAAIRQALGDLLAAAHDAVNGHSPARAFIPLGEDIMAGIQQGLASGLNIPMNYMSGALPQLATAGAGASGYQSAQQAPQYSDIAPRDNRQFVINANIYNDMDVEELAARVTMVQRQRGT